MDATTLTSRLAHEYGLLRAALDAADPKAGVPTCPDWTVADLEEHVTAVYLHKVETMRQGAFPKPWPPTEGVGTLEDAYAALVSEFAARKPEDHSVTWFEPDQTVGFWIRRMAQETAIHRVDAALAAGIDVTPIEPDLAVDGIDEVLGWVVHAVVAWPDEFADVFAKPDLRPVRLTTRGSSWTIRATPDSVQIDSGPDLSEAAATVTGSPDALYRWLWNRGDDPAIDGDPALIAQLKALTGPVQ
jgi:uncharacterized protein (TIGR03083 family)